METGTTLPALLIPLCVGSAFYVLDDGVPRMLIVACLAGPLVLGAVAASACTGGRRPGGQSSVSATGWAGVIAAIGCGLAAVALIPGYGKVLLFSAIGLYACGYLAVQSAMLLRSSSGPDSQLPDR